MNIATKSTDAHTKNYHMVQIIIVVVPGAPGRFVTRLPQIVSFVVQAWGVTTDPESAARKSAFTRLPSVTSPNTFLVLKVSYAPQTYV